MSEKRYVTTTNYKSICLLGPMMRCQVHIDMLQDVQLFINLLMKLLTTANNGSFPLLL